VIPATIVAALQEAPPPWEVGAQSRARVEARSPVGFRAGAGADEFLTTRLRPHLKARPGDGIEIFVQPQLSWGLWGEEPEAPGQDEEDLHQALAL
jgi:hypothetical protein